MILEIPDYFKEFKCIGGDCKHTCCADWEIDVDKKTYDYYCSVEGEFGERLRQNIRKDKDIHIVMLHGKCPFLDKDQLCGVYKTLGEKAMCGICTQYPREYEDYGNRRLKVLNLSCEEVARILFCKKDKIKFELQEVADKMLEQDAHKEAKKDDEVIVTQERCDWFIKIRDYCINLLQDRRIPLSHRIKEFLRLSDPVQTCIHENHLEQIITIIQESKEQMNALVKNQLQSASKPVDFSTIHHHFQNRMDIWMDMEVVEEEWGEESNNVMRAFHSDSHAGLYQEISNQFDAYMNQRDYEYEHLMVYFVYRYLMDSVKHGEFSQKARYSVVCYLMIRDLDRVRFLLQGMQFQLEDRMDNIRIFCKELEHTKVNVDYINSKIKTEPVFSTESLMEQI